MRLDFTTYIDTLIKFYKKNTRLLPSIFLVYFAGLLIYQVVVSNIWYVSAMKKQEYSWYYEQNSRLIAENATLKSELQALMENVELMESLARSKLGLIKKGEQFYTYGTPEILTPTSTIQSQ